MKLSVITINLNDKVGLEKTIQSLLKQKFSDYEFIVIDGASTDGSVDIIKKYEDKINYWISEPDSGVYNAMNKGIAKAKGEYCYFLNSGDYLVSEDVLMNIFTGDIHESFICGNFITDTDSNLTRNTPYASRDWLFSLYDIFSGFLAHQAFFIKKEMFDKYELYDERLKVMSDWKHFFIAIGINHEKVLYRDVDIAVYNTDGLSSRIGGKAIYKEKVLVAKEELTPQLFNRLDRLYYLERNDFVVDFVHSRKWIHFFFKVFYKLCIMFKLTKV